MLLVEVDGTTTGTEDIVVDDFIIRAVSVVVAACFGADVGVCLVFLPMVFVTMFVLEVVAAAVGRGVAVAVAVVDFVKIGCNGCRGWLGAYAWTVSLAKCSSRRTGNSILIITTWVSMKHHDWEVKVVSILADLIPVQQMDLFRRKSLIRRSVIRSYGIVQEEASEELFVILSTKKTRLCVTFPVIGFMNETRIIVDPLSIYRQICLYFYCYTSSGC